MTFRFPAEKKPVWPVLAVAAVLSGIEYRDGVEYRNGGKTVLTFELDPNLTEDVNGVFQIDGVYAYFSTRRGYPGKCPSDPYIRRKRKAEAAIAAMLPPSGLPAAAHTDENGKEGKST